ncbi:MAG: transposase [Planctomycetaceae bacterium]
MSDRRHTFDDRLYGHFITFSCDRRRRLLEEDQPKRILLGRLNEQLRLQAADCVGFVIMSDHVHAIIQFSAPGQLSRFMHGWKRTSSYHIREWYREQDFNYFKTAAAGNRLWTPKYYSFEIYTRKKLEQKLIYMHLNPVRAGLVGRAIDWRWSSARWYELRRSVGVPLTWIN